MSASGAFVSYWMLVNAPRISAGVPAELARTITAAVKVPTIGIGAGPHCDAQVLVLHDFLGLTTGRTPRFVKRYASLGDEVTRAAKEFAREVAEGSFPDSEHSYD